MDSRNIAARRRRATPRKSARTTAAPSDSKRTPSARSRALQATRNASRAAAPTQQRVTRIAAPPPARREHRAPVTVGAAPPPVLTRGFWPTLPTMLAFVGPPFGSFKAAGSEGKTPPSRRAGASIASKPLASGPLLPTPSEPSEPSAAFARRLDWGDGNDDDDLVNPWREEERGDDPRRTFGKQASGAWPLAPTVADRLHEWVARALPYSWSERAWRRGYWRRRLAWSLGVVAIVAVVTLIVFAAFSIALRATHASLTSLSSVSTATPSQGSFVVNAANSGANATPASPAYTIGVWASSDSPGGGQVTLFARVTHNYGPMKGAYVIFTVQYPNGAAINLAAKTDSAGLARTLLTYGAIGQGQIIFVTASSHVGAQDISADSSFTTF